MQKDNFLYNKTNDYVLVSIIMPIFNSPDVTASIDSVLKQNYENIQFIILDDASYNFDCDKVRSYIDKNARENLYEIIIRQNKKNIGTVRNMNQGFRLAKGKYIFSLAGDDVFYDEGVISDWVKEFEVTGAGLITAKRVRYDEMLSKEYGIEPSEEKINLIKHRTPMELFEDMCAYNFIFGCCTARSKSFIDEVGLFDEDYRLIDDYPMLLQYFRKGYSIHFFDRIVIKYRSGGISAERNYDKAYERDAKKILKKEILPFTYDQNRARKEFKEWEKKQIKGKYRTLKNSPIQKIKIILYYVFHYPEDIGYLIKKYCIRGDKNC